MAREFANAFYRSKEWAAVREFAMMRDGFLCRRCGAPAEEVHHIEHLTPKNIWDPNVALNPDNLECLCRDCHFREHAEDKAAGHRLKEAQHIEGMDYEFGPDGMVRPRSN